MPGQGKESEHIEKVYMEKRQAPGHPRIFTLKKFTNKADCRCNVLLFSLIILSEPIFH